MGVKTYDASQVTIIFGAIPILNGFADGTFVTVEPAGPAWTTQVGTDGEVTRSKTNNRTAVVTLTLMQSAAANDLLSARWILDDNTPGGLGVVAFFLKDNSGNTLVGAVESWIEQQPTAEFGREAGNRVWKIALGRAVTYHGGN